MPVIIDANCLAHVFKRNSERHAEFKPVLEWILRGKGVMVFGGTKYRKELLKAKRYLPIINILKDYKKVVIGDPNMIDHLEEQIKAKIDDPDFDDPHLPAIVIATKCLVICSVDYRSIKHVQSRELYPKGFPIPKYYTGLRNSRLLCEKYIHNNFPKSGKLTQSELAKLDSILNPNK